jgi:uncharacterized protein (TIGR03067 family)
MLRAKSLMLVLGLAMSWATGGSGSATQPTTQPTSPPTSQPAVTKDAGLRQFVGTWALANVQPAGITKEAQFLKFQLDGTYAALDKDGKELWAGTFDLDSGKSPMVWDHRSHEAAKTGGDALGIYDLNGDRLRLACVVGSWKEKQWTGKPRPTAFALPEADAVLELKRVANP